MLDNPVPVYPTIADWIEQDAIPFLFAAPGNAVDEPNASFTAGFDAAVDTMMAALGQTVELLGLGEALHGGEEILHLRNRLFQRLVEAHGFRAIALESSFTRGHAVDEYVAGRGFATFEALQDAGFSHGFGRLDANRELVEWMRRANAGRLPEDQLRFYGFDTPTEMMGSDSPRQALMFALDYLDALEGAAGDPPRRTRIDVLLGADADWENPAAMMDPAQSVGLSPAAAALRVETEDLIARLQMRRPDAAAAGDLARYLEALQHAVAARWLFAYHAAVAHPAESRLVDLLALRDAAMADNLAYALARERGRGKVLAFAHNQHLQRGKAAWQLGPHALSWWTAGAHVAALCGARYAVIGSGVGVSAENGIAPPEAGTLEAQLTAGPQPDLFIPTHGGQALPSSVIAALPTRAGSVKNSMYFPLSPACFTDFDRLVVLRSVTYSRGGPPLP